MRLYCFPHAGATSSVYRPWHAMATPPLRIVGVDRPGRGTRAREPRIEDYRTLVESTADFVVADLRKAGEGPWATFGHSFGAMLSLAVAASVARAVGNPERVILSAALPPRLQPPGDETESLTDAELLAKIARDGGTVPELLASSAMSGYLVRLMREDHAVRRQFAEDRALRVDFPLTLVAARQDVHGSPAQMWQWSEHSGSPCHRVEIPGNHFAAVHNPEEIIATLYEGAC